MDKLKPIIAQLAQGKPLSEDQATEAFSILLSGDATQSQIGSFLMALHLRGETVTELVAGAKLLREYVVPVRAPENAIDTCGTGGDNVGTYNISTAASFIIAACGVPVTKHGNRALSSKSGSAEVLESLGVRLDLQPAQITHCIETVGLGFMFAPLHHSAMKHVGAARAELGIRTIFNLLGPLANPASAKYQLLGVFDKAWVEPIAHVLAQLGSRAAWVVHGSDGLDELTSTGTTHVAALKDGQVTQFDIAPEDADLPRAQMADLIGGTPAENAQALRAVLDGKTGAYRDIVVLNAAAALLITGHASDLRDGAHKAQTAIDEGHAAKLLDQFIALSQG